MAVERRSGVRVSVDTMSKVERIKSAEAAARERGVKGRFPASLAAVPAKLFSRAAAVSVTEFSEQLVKVECPGRPPRAKTLRIAFDAPASMTIPFAGIRCSFSAEMVAARDLGTEPERCELTLKWSAPLSTLIESASAARGRWIGVALFALLGFMLWQRRGAVAEFWYDPLLTLYMITIGSYFFSRFILAPLNGAPEFKSYEPTLTVVVSVRNDRECIGQTVATCFGADYPSEKRQVIVVDDGSNDGTETELKALQKRFPELQVHTIPPSGKRFAMAKGIREATGDIIVVVDSDTLLDRMALRHIVCGFEDPTLGAAAGYTAVANADKNLLTRMQDVRYLVSYELMKAPESLFSAVTCCPGCLSAYRKEYLMKILDPWLNQMFMGTRATFGDDRSLTNYILRDYRVIYNPLARASTMVPENWMHYMRQQCRWKKSWLREAPVAGRILATKHPVAALSFYASAVCSLTSPLVVLKYFFAGRGELMAGYFTGMIMLGGLLSLFALWRRPTKYWYVSWFWLITQIFLMAPQTYYALLTMRKNHWGTR